MTDREVMQQALEALEDERYVTKYTHIVDVITALRTALEQPQQEPVAWQYKTVEANIFVSEHRPVDVSVWQEIEWSKPLYTTPPATQPEHWDKPSARFNEWWDSDSDSKVNSTNPFRNGSAAYWAWAGWQAAQRPWVGLTDEDVNRESSMIASKMKLAFHAGMYVAQKILKERNT